MSTHCSLCNEPKMREHKCKPVQGALTKKDLNRFMTWEQDFDEEFVHKNYHQEIPDIWKVPKIGPGLFGQILPDDIKHFIRKLLLK